MAGSNKYMPQIRRGKGFLKGGAPLFLLLIGGSLGLAAIIQQKIDVKVRTELCLPADRHLRVCAPAQMLSVKDDSPEGLLPCRTAIRKPLR